MCTSELSFTSSFYYSMANTHSHVTKFQSPLVISEVYAFLYCSVLSLGSRVNARRMPHKKSMQISSHRKLLCEFSKLSKFNAFILLGYKMNTDASILVYKYHPERTGFNMYTENTQPQLTFLALLPWIYACFSTVKL